jgi:myosin heavy subunit
MSTYNYPQTESTAAPMTPPARKDYRNLIYILLTTGLIAALGYIWYDKTRQKQDEQKNQEQLMAANVSKDQVEGEYKNALARMDSMAIEGSSKDEKINNLETEISKKKNEINSLIAIKNRTAKENATLRSKIEELNGLISERNARITELETQNQELTNENQIVKTERDQVRTELETSRTEMEKERIAKKAAEDQVDVGSTLHASNFVIDGINERRGGKEKETDNYKKADKLRISFDLEPNRITASGKKQLYVLVTAPDGQLVTVEALGSGKFNSREGEKMFTSMMEVDYEQGMKKSVSFDWKQNSKFQEGNYKVEVYQNGFKIGEGKTSLKKKFLNIG